MDERGRTAGSRARRGRSAVAGSSFPGKGHGMRIDRQRGETQRRQALAAVDSAKLAQVKAGLKAERVQGTDPTQPGGA